MSRSNGICREDGTGSVFGAFPNTYKCFITLPLLAVFRSLSITEFVQMLIVLWMTRSITDDIPGWAALFNGRAGDGTVSVSFSVLRKIPNALHVCIINSLTNSN